MQMEETPNDIHFRQVNLTDPSPLLSKLHQNLITCAKSLESDDFSPSNASLCNLIGFLDSISDSALSDPNHIETAKTASLVLAELHRFVSSPSLSQMVVDALAFELPKAVVRFAGVSDECRGIVDSVVDHFVAVCNPRDMHSVLCEEIVKEDHIIEVPHIDFVFEDRPLLLEDSKQMILQNLKHLMVGSHIQADFRFSKQHYHTSTSNWKIILKSKALSPASKRCKEKEDLEEHRGFVRLTFDPGGLL